jgi:hypothetical protein
MDAINVGLSELHAVTSQKTTLFIVPVVKTASATQALIKQEANKFSLNSPLASAAFLLALLFDSDDGGDIFFRNIGLFLNYTALQLGMQPKQQEEENGDGEDMWPGWTTRDGHTPQQFGTRE